mgnify:CR=1 FL=1
MRQHFVFRNHGSGGILGDHQAGIDAAVLDQKSGQAGELRVYQPLGAAFGDIRQLGDSDGDKIHSQTHGFAVEIAAGNHVVLIREDNGVIRHSVDFPGNHVVGIADAVPAGAVNLGHAAQRIGVLHFVWLDVGGQAAAFQQAQHIGGAVDLSLMARTAWTLGS